MDVPMETWDEQAVVSRDFLASEQHIGYIGVRLFTPDSGDQVRKAVESLATHDVRKCIIDLRNNPGGYLDLWPSPEARSRIRRSVGRSGGTIRERRSIQRRNHIRVCSLSFSSTRARRVTLSAPRIARPPFPSLEGLGFA
jgi:hypothetical protein